MGQYIDKSALVAEIERLLLIHTKRYDELAKHEVWVTAKEIENRIQGLKEALSIINTLEVKEVDLDSDIRTYLTNHFNIYEDGVLQSKKSGLPLRTYDIIKVAKHFFELGMIVGNKAQKGEEV